MGFRRPDLEIAGTAKVFEFPPHRAVKEVPVDKKRMAQMLGVNPKFLERRHKAEGFPVSFDAAGRARYVPSEVRHWLSQQREGGSNDAA